MSTDIAAIDKVHRAIASGIFGQIQWDDRSGERARSNPELQGLTPQGIRRLLHEFVAAGGRLRNGGTYGQIGSKPTPTGRPTIAIFGIGLCSQ
jgi:hypothetical protein